MKFSAHLFGISALLTSFSMALPALAANGVIEINQAKVAIGGVTTNDGPGFPVNIGNAGHYRLTSNLVVSELVSPFRIIDIEADNVTIDLNGFSIIGPVTCQAGAGDVTCTNVPNIRSAIRVRTGATNTTILNGTISGFESGINCQDTGCVVKNVSTHNNSGSGISLGPKGRVSNCSSYLNGGSGIRASALAFIENSIMSLNGYAGLFVIDDGVTAISNTFYSNAERSIDMNSHLTSIGGNTFNPKTTGAWFLNNSKMTEISPNVCIDGSAPYTNCTGL